MTYLSFLIWILQAGLFTAPLPVPENSPAADNHSRQLFDSLAALAWETELVDDMTQGWETNWTLDGKLARLTHSEKGLDFWAGPKAKVDSNHAVLWTRQSFRGDIKVDYTYTKLDESHSFVTILYILATGSGAPGYDADIQAWADKRKIPSMRTYFRHMHALHISYAAFRRYQKGHPKAGQRYDYIRGRRYLPERKAGMEGTQLEPDYLETGLFAPGIPHDITVLKKGMDFFMFCRNPEKEFLCHWRLDKHPAVEEGRVALRHMYTRAARYRDFRISSLQE